MVSRALLSGMGPSCWNRDRLHATVKASAAALLTFRIYHPDKTIKLWKVFEKTLKVVAENNSSTSGFSPIPQNAAAPLANSFSPSSPSSLITSSLPPSLILPRLTHHDTIVAAVPRKVYANAHAYHINSISINSDGETYMSADDLRVNLWNLERSDQSFSESKSIPSFRMRTY